ncbi:MAG: JAB domain-containing protein [Enterococcus canintestini]|uniref:JAB domain-containing protein n=1 Tax=Enterococcus canintestini TaxID=317010 RepID=UPI00399392D1
MKDYKANVTPETITRLLGLVTNVLTRNNGELTDYLMLETGNIALGRIKPRKFIIAIGVENGYEMTLTDNEKKVEKFKKSLTTVEDSKVREDETKKQYAKSVLKLQQVYVGEEKSYYKVGSSFGLSNYASEQIGNNSSEALLVLALNTKNEVIAFTELFRGSLNQSIAHPREIFQFALLNNSARIICSHNHPSGNPTPSENDNAFTARLRQAGELLGIELLDHVIVTDEATKYYSYREEGKI